jgi:hypothetical protein
MIKATDRILLNKEGKEKIKDFEIKVKKDTATIGDFLVIKSLLETIIKQANK